MSENWCVYVAECSDGSLYCGITTETSRRIYEHNTTKKGAKYTRSRRPVKLVFQSKTFSRSKASSIEAKFKKLPTNKKRQLIKSDELFNSHFHIDDEPTSDS